MHEYQRRFIELAIEHDVLKFGEFTLKSGRVSPYFFNVGNFRSGRALSMLGQCYADAIAASKLEFDLLFGPAYKGIPLVAVIAAALFERHGLDFPYSFNRKEAKQHGEGGTIVGAEPEGRVLIVDDVITAGTAVGEVISMLGQTPAQPAAVFVGLDRQEQGQNSGLSAIDELSTVYELPVRSIVGLDQVRAYVANHGDKNLVARIDAYREQYGAV